MPKLREDDPTPPPRNPTPTEWSLHPELPRVGVPLVAPTGEQQRKLEHILSEVQESLKESRLIRLSGQQTAETAMRVFERLPALERRMNRVELIAIGATIINIVMLFVASCGR